MQSKIQRLTNSVVLREDAEPSLFAALAVILQIAVGDKATGLVRLRYAPRRERVEEEHYAARFAFASSQQPAANFH